MAGHGSEASYRTEGSNTKQKGNFVIVDFLFTNNADEATTLDQASLVLLDGEGCEIANSDDFVYIAPGKDIFSENVNPGVTKDGQVIFTVDPDAKDFTLRLVTRIRSSRMRTLT